MATLSRTDFGLVTIAPPNTNRFPGFVCGEDITAGHSVTIRSDKLIYKKDTGDRFMGVAMTNAQEGEPCTIMHGVVVRYTNTLTPMTLVYADSTAAGNLTDTATGNGSAVGIVLDDQRVYIFTL